MTEEEPCDVATMEAFNATCASEAADLALLFAGEPERKMAAALDAMRESMEPDLADALGAEAAAIFCEAFVAEVRRRRAKIEEIASFRGGRWA